MSHCQPDYTAITESARNNAVDSAELIVEFVDILSERCGEALLSLPLLAWMSIFGVDEAEWRWAGTGGFRSMDDTRLKFGGSFGVEGALRMGVAFGLL